VRYFLLALILGSGVASAHQWTPAYPTWQDSYMTGIVQTRMNLFNTRQDVDYFEVEVLDVNMKPIDFATTDRIVHTPYLKRKTVDVYIRRVDIDRVVYICSVSKLLVQGSTGTSVSSRICSKVKNALSPFDNTAAGQ
jgi:hypothetical protein